MIFQVADILVVDKPAGRDVIPARGAGREESLRDAWSREAGVRLWVVHRLDRDTSGVLVFAKNPEAHRDLCRAFESRAVGKTYLAVVRGRPEPEEGRLTDPLREYGSGRMAADPKGKASETRYRTLFVGQEEALVLVRPMTGRRHQIRAHFAGAGHPVLGDRTYGPPPRPVSGAARLMLHAWRLELPGPPGKRRVLEAPIPEAFRTWARVVGAPEIVYRGPGEMSRQ